MNTATTFLVVTPLVLLIVSFLSPYSKHLGFDKPQVAQETLPQVKPALPVLAKAETKVEPSISVLPVHSLPIVEAIIPETPREARERIVRGLKEPAPEAANGFYEVGQEELVDIPADWLPGGKNSPERMAQYVDFSEVDRYSIDAEHSNGGGKRPQTEFLDASSGLWVANEDEEEVHATV